MLEFWRWVDRTVHHPIMQMEKSSPGGMTQVIVKAKAELQGLSWLIPWDFIPDSEFVEHVAVLCHSAFEN